MTSGLSQTKTLIGEVEVSRKLRLRHFAINDAPEFSQLKTLTLLNWVTGLFEELTATQAIDAMRTRKSVLIAANVDHVNEWACIDRGSSIPYRTVNWDKYNLPLDLSDKDSRIWDGHTDGGSAIKGMIHLRYFVAL
jgi:hypothetical protein